MKNDWTSTTVGEIADKLAMGPFGSSIKVASFVQHGIPIISGQHLHGFRLDDTPGFNYITTQHAERLLNANVRRGDIIFTHAGNIGNVAYIPEDSENDRYVISQRQFYLRCDLDKAIPEFVTAYFKSPAGQHQLLANASQVGVPAIAQPVSYLKTVPILLPPLHEQRAIAHTLTMLDDKISLNRKMNHTLGQIARTLFRSWFVELDPVRAKMDGRWHHGQSLPGLPASIYDAFPENLVPSPLGEIPQGWELKTVGDLATISGGTTPSTKIREYWDGGTHCWATPKDLSILSTPILLDTDRKITNEGLGRIGSGLQPPGTVLLSSRAPIGYLAINEVPTAINQGFIAMQPKDDIPNSFLLRWCEANADEILNHANGSTFLEISKSNFRSIQIAKPNPEVLSAYGHIASIFHNRMVANEESTRLLIEQRDTLLPKLVAGEIAAAPS